MKQTTRDIFGASKNVLEVGGHFITVPVKVTASNITADADGNKIVKAGTILSKTGTIVNNNTAFGIVYEDLDVTGGNDSASVIVHGIVKLSEMETAPDSTAKAVLPMILFV